MRDRLVSFIAQSHSLAADPASKAKGSLRVDWGLERA